MLGPFIQIAAPALALLAIGYFFQKAARRTWNADPEKYRRAQKDTGSAENAVAGSVGSASTSTSYSNQDYGMVSKREGDLLIIARQARLPDSTVSTL